MLTLPAELLPLIIEFAPLFSKPVWEHAQVLLVGAILAPGKRTVTACLRVMGLSQEKCFVNYHRVLNRARWSALAASRILVRLLMATFAPQGELIVGLDDTIERRRGDQIKAKGIYRDPVRSSHSHFVKASGLRWLCAMLLVKVSWAGSIWGLPFLTVLRSVGTLPRRTWARAPEADPSGSANHATDEPLPCRIESWSLSATTVLPCSICSLR
jgi:DDE superfamily endonuclease